VFALEKAAALTRHDLNESKRRLEQESELRAKTDSKLREAEIALETERHSKQTTMSNSQQLGERAQQLEKQVGSVL